MTKKRELPIKLEIRQLDLRLSRLERDVKLTSNVLQFLLNIFISLDEKTAQKIKSYIETLELIK